MAMAVAVAMAMAITQSPLPLLSHGVRFNSFRSSQRNPHEKLRLCSSSSFNLIRAKAHNGGEEREGEDMLSSSSISSSYSVMAAMRSLHNDIVVVDTPDSRVLLLDSTHNIHSMLNKEQKWTGSYWDEFASIPAIIPQGPIALLGLGAGTAAHLMLDLWPSLHIEGWEIDEILIDMAREFFGLSILEKRMPAGGSLSVRIGDALSPSVAVQGGFAGIIVDLFSDGKILPQLAEDATWLEIEKKLMPHGRIMVNCGGAHAELSDSQDRTKASQSGCWLRNSTIKALCRVFPGKALLKLLAAAYCFALINQSQPIKEAKSYICS